MMLGPGGPVGLPRNVQGPADAPPGHEPTAHDLANEALLHDAGIRTGGVPRWAWAVTGFIVLAVLVLLLR
jgi:hypothetical protein